MKRPEQALQRAVVDYLRLALPSHIVIHVPNGGGRSHIEAAILKGIGVRAGVADLLIMGDGRVWHLELKRPGGRQSPAQVGYQAECVAKGLPYAVASSLEEVEAALASWGLEPRARIQGGAR